MALIPDEYMRPDMMAIGDSLYQGVRSLTIKRGLMQLSAPAQIAEALGIRHRFTCPDPMCPILVDMEAWLRMLPSVSDVKADLAVNANYWFGKPKSPSGTEFFENIAVASATVADLYTQSWQTSEDYLKRLPSGVKPRIKNLNWGDLDLARIVQSFNARFTLNPSGKRRYRGFTQVGLVAARRPKRLLINIGSNNGLWDMVFDAKPAGRIRMRQELKFLAQQLNALPPDVTDIYFNSLGVPSTVPNLMPLPDQEEWERKPGRGAYYDRYENRFGFGYGTMTGAQLERLDARVAEANEEARQILRAAFDDKKRLHFVDLAGLQKSRDAKHRKRTKTNVVKLKNRKTLSNVTTEANFFGGFARGGLAGLDGMHPTVVGYALMAERVLKAVAKAEPGERPKAIDLDHAFERDSLLTDMPGIWSLGLWLWRDVRRAQGRGDPNPASAPEREGIAGVLEACSRTIRT
jgi:lysophospholipase L1-like esterase